jgi:hypothetical protein
MPQQPCVDGYYEMRGAAGAVQGAGERRGVEAQEEPGPGGRLRWSVVRCLFSDRAIWRVESRPARSLSPLQSSDRPRADK